jgi:hypothetical protein
MENPDIANNHHVGPPGMINAADKYTTIRKNAAAYNIINSTIIPDRIANPNNGNNIKSINWTINIFTHMDEIIQALLDLRKTILNTPTTDVIYHFNPKADSFADNIYTPIYNMTKGIYSAKGESRNATNNIITTDKGFYDDFTFILENYINNGAWRSCQSWYRGQVPNEIINLYKLIMHKDEHTEMFNYIDRLSLKNPNIDFDYLADLYQDIIKIIFKFDTIIITNEMTELFRFLQPKTINNLDEIIDILNYCNNLLKDADVKNIPYLQIKYNTLKTFYKKKSKLFKKFISRIMICKKFLDCIKAKLGDNFDSILADKKDAFDLRYRLLNKLESKIKNTIFETDYTIDIDTSNFDNFP